MEDDNDQTDDQTKQVIYQSSVLLIYVIFEDDTCWKSFIRVIIDISYYKDTYIDGNFILKQK